MTAALRVIGWTAVAVGTVWNGSRSAPVPVEASSPDVHVISGLAAVPGDHAPRFDLLRPIDATSPAPVLIAVHGGSWTGGSRRDYAPQFLPLAERGIAVAVVDYRPARPGSPSWDGALRDVLAVVDWVDRRGREHGLDARRIAVLGTSAGGLLAARAGQSDPRVRAIVGLSTPSSLVDLVAARHLRHDPVRVFLGSDATRDQPRARDASPAEWVEPSSPPILSIHGTDDAWVPVDQARNLHKKLDAAGVTNRLIEIKGARHGFELKLGDPSPLDLTPVVQAFLESAWGLVQRGVDLELIHD